VVELYRAAAAGGNKGNAARFEKIRKKLRQELGRMIRAGEDTKELKRRLVEAGVIPGKGGASAKPAKIQEDAGEIFRKAVQAPKKKPEYQDAIDQALAELKRRKEEAGGVGVMPVPSNLRKELNELAGKDPQIKPAPRQASLSKDVMDDISRILRGEDPVHMQIVSDANLRTINKSQIAQLQSVLGMGALSRKEVGRDLEGLLNEAKDLRARKQQEFALAPAAEWPKLQGELSRINRAIVGPITAATEKVKYAREDAGYHDGIILAKGISKELGDKKYGWDDSYRSGSKLLGEGAFGTVLREPNKGNAVKRGDIGKNEPTLLKRIGEVDLGPKLLAAQLDGAGDEPGSKLGRIAMSVLPGSPIKFKAPDEEINGVKVADAYWIARAQLHRMGIAHNDMHVENVFIDRKGKGRFVDMGLSQDSPKAALAEAMGAFDRPSGATATRAPGAKGQGDWQVRRWEGSGGQLLARGQGRGATPAGRAALRQKAPVLAEVVDNKAAVMFEMKRDGFTNDDIATIMDHGIRSSMTTYEKGVWGRMSNDQAQKYINLLYEGV